MKAYGFFEVRDGGRQLVFEEVVIEAEDYEVAKRAYERWLLRVYLETQAWKMSGDGHAEVMDISLAPKRAHRMKPIRAEELLKPLDEVIKTALAEVS
ncbi:hypothetical protein [Thermococcus sp.]|uniref:hypothetical protein n=1 Tax=Thermococcus sp. TaxID=35749 RepID=UPI0026158051|nr:hypothetical protein [Thermococcus sp.]